MYMVQSEHPEHMQYQRESPYERNRFFMEPNAILSESLSLSSDIPLYAQLVGIIKRSISSGALAIGDLLPSEAELCRALNVSRNTVRQAIGELEDEGLVVRKRGKGTFVADPNTNRRGVALFLHHRSLLPGQDALLHAGGLRRYRSYTGHLREDGAAGGDVGLLLHPCPQCGR